MKKFDKVYKYYDKFIDLFNLNKMDEIKEIMNLKGDEVVLDIGGGTGKLADYVSKDCRKIYVLDESRGMLSRIKPNKKVIPLLGNALETDFVDKSIDVVIIADVLHHIKDQEGLIDEIHRILKGNGKLIILDFEKNHIKIMLLRIFESILFGRLYFKGGREVIKLVESKFVIKSAKHKGYYFIIKGEKNAR